MTTGSWDLIEAVASRWDANGLDGTFEGYRNDVTLTERFPILHDTEATEECPFPYCVFEQGRPDEREYMTDGDDSTQVKVIERVNWQFRIHARNKEDCVNLAKAVDEVFDGAVFCCGTGYVVRNGKVADMGVRNDEDEWHWLLDYQAIFDYAKKINPDS